MIVFTRGGLGTINQSLLCSSLTLLLPLFKEVTGTLRGMWSLGLRQHGVIENNFLFYGLLGLVHVDTVGSQRGVIDELEQQSTRMTTHPDTHLFTTSFNALLKTHGIFSFSVHCSLLSLSVFLCLLPSYGLWCISISVLSFSSFFPFLSPSAFLSSFSSAFLFSFCPQSLPCLSLCQPQDRPTHI